jgi:uncharacterized membrane-anchored protein
MKGNWKLWALAGAIALQLLVLAGELINANYPLWTGQEIRLQVEPVDPRSLFRGNYARLDYDIANVRQCDKSLERDLRKGDVVYVHLKPDDAGIMRARGFSVKPPDGGTFIRGRVKWVQHGCPELDVRYGIEAYFLPREKALALEAELRREKAVARVMLAPNGKATLVGVEEKPAPQ